MKFIKLRHNMTLLMAFLVIGFGVMVNGCDNSSGSDEPDIVEAIQGEDNLSSLASAIESAGLSSTLSGEGPYTVFAPINDSLDAVSSEVPSEVLPAVLQYHVVAGRITSDDIEMGTTEVETVEGDMIYITKDENGNVYVNGGRTSFPIGGTVVEADLMASNGVIHKVNGVFTPNQITSAAGNIAKRMAYDTGSLVALAAQFPELLSGLQGDPTGGSGITVFAPNNAAFSDVETQLGAMSNDQKKATLLYHVAQGTVMSSDLTSGDLPTLLQYPGTSTYQTLTIDTSSDTPIQGKGGGMAAPTVTDIQSSNGVVHIIDAVVFPPSPQQ
jgi:uncharacterized surface protein with fasciclin (FAS1) repeats